MLKKLSLAQKLLISNILYGIPVVVLMSFMITAKTKDISFAELEKYGNEYQRPLETLLQLVAKHRLVAQRALSGDAASQSELAVFQGQVDHAILSVADVDKKLGEALQFTDEALKQRKRENFRISLVKNKWTGMKEKLAQMKPAESAEQHASLIGDVRGMITHMGDTSNLILDPDLDSYYLMDVTLGALPQTQDRIQEITAYVESILRRKSITTEERIQLNTYATLLRTVDLDRVVASTQTALNEDANFYGRSESLQRNVPKALAEVQAAVGNLADLTKKISGSDQVTVTPDAYLAVSAKANAVSYEYWNICVEELDRLLQARIDSIKAGRAWSVLLGLAALVFAAGVSWYIAVSLRKSLSQAVSRLTQSAASTSSASAELVHTSQTLSSSSAEQAAAIQETSATLEEINAMVNKSLENASRSANVAETSQNTAIGGKESVEKMIHAIGDINQSNAEIVAQINESNERISEIVQIINEIGTKTKVINDIVFQTKLLSFNASVEAARAGEHGKGFSVVAEEVGSLAEMSGNAAKEITAMLESSVQKVTAIVDDTKAKVDRLVSMGKAKVEVGTQVARGCGSSLEEVVKTVSDVNRLVGEISGAAGEQAKGVNEITNAMQQLDQATQQNAAMSSETAGFAEALSKQAAELREVVSAIEQEVFGHASGGQPANNVLSITARKREEPKASAKRAEGTEILPAQDDLRFREV